MTYLLGIHNNNGELGVQYILDTYECQSLIPKKRTPHPSSENLKVSDPYLPHVSKNKKGKYGVSRQKWTPFMVAMNNGTGNETVKDLGVFRRHKSIFVLAQSKQSILALNSINALPSSNPVGKMNYSNLK